MRLTWRDGATTVLAAVTVAIALAVTQEWGWPLLGSVAAGMVILAIVGVAMCTLSGSTASATSKKNPYTITMSGLGVAALVLIVAGLIARSEPVLLALAVVTVVMWLVSTTAHLIVGKPAAPAA